MNEGQSKPKRGGGSYKTKLRRVERKAAKYRERIAELERALREQRQPKPDFEPFDVHGLP